MWNIKKELMELVKAERPQTLQTRWKTVATIPQSPRVIAGGDVATGQQQTLSEKEQLLIALTRKTRSCKQFL